jgi:hypothetical protein
MRPAAAISIYDRRPKVKAKWFCGCEIIRRAPGASAHIADDPPRLAARRLTAMR